MEDKEAIDAEAINTEEIDTEGAEATDTQAMEAINTEDQYRDWIRMQQRPSIRRGCKIDLQIAFKVDWKEDSEQNKVRKKNNKWRCMHKIAALFGRSTFFNY